MPTPQGRMVVPVGFEAAGTAPISLLVTSAGKLVVDTERGGMDTLYLARAYANSGDAVGNGALADVQLDAETADPNGNFSIVTYKYTAPVAGYYAVNGQVTWLAAQVVANKTVCAAIVRNATVVAQRYAHTDAASNVSAAVSDIVHLDAGDTIKMQCVHTFAAAKTYSGLTADTFLSIHILSAD